MSMRRLAILLSLLLCVLWGRVTTSQVRQAGPFDYPGSPVELYLNSMTSLPNDVVFLGGSYRIASGPVHSALLVSRDAGRTWEEQDVRFEASGIARFETYSQTHVWAIVTFQTEGVNSPEHLLISDDGGLSWERVSLDVLQANRGLFEVDQFRFFDARHGIIYIRNTVGGETLFQTSNGGRSWHPVWEAFPDRSVEFLEPREPLQAPLFRETLGEYRLAGGLRVWSDPDAVGPYVIQRFDGPYVAVIQRLDASWEPVSTIERRYVVRNGLLQPQP